MAAKINASNWNGIAKKYSSIKESRRNSVFPAIIKKLQRLKISRLLDYGGGDGYFAKSCVQLPIAELYTYDPAPDMLKLAKEKTQRCSRINVIGETDQLESGTFDVVTFNAVWMCLPDWRSCMNALVDIYRLLRPLGHLIVSVTHPCFRSVKYENFAADFDMRNYLSYGVKFPVHIFENEKALTVVDTHWNLTAMSKQLKEVGF